MESHFQMFADWLDKNAVEKFPVQNLPVVKEGQRLFIRGCNWVSVTESSIPEHFKGLLMGSPDEA